MRDEVHETDGPLRDEEVHVAALYFTARELELIVIAITKGIEHKEIKLIPYRLEPLQSMLFHLRQVLRRVK